MTPNSLCSHHHRHHRHHHQVQKLLVSSWRLLLHASLVLQSLLLQVLLMLWLQGSSKVQRCLAMLGKAPTPNPTP